MRRRRVRRAGFAAVVSSAVVAGGLTYLILTSVAGMNGNAAAMLGTFAAGIMVRHGIRVPTIRINWRRR